MNADAETDSESPKKRGRIPQSAWPQILERHRAGATLSAIAREFSCTPSAISYIIRKAEAQGVEAASVEDEGPDAETEEAPPPVVAEPPPAPPAPVAVVTERVPIAERPRMHMPSPPVEPPPPPVPPRVEVAPAPARERPAVPGGRPEPAPPVDEVEGRLRETARVCLASYRGWRQAPGETSIQALSDAVHELRKALARIEIDMSASRREEQAIRPIPIPSHRASRRPL